jgi:hypothetical protein
MTLRRINRLHGRFPIRNDDSSPAPRARVGGLVRTRARLLRLIPERRKPRLRTGPRQPSDLGGYNTEELGPKLE